MGPSSAGYLNDAWPPATDSETQKEAVERRERGELTNKELEMQFA